MFTTSCSDDEEDAEPLGPSLFVTETQSASTGGDIETTPNAPLIFAIEARKGENDLDKISILQNGSNVVQPLPQSYKGKEYPYSFPNADDNTYVDTIAFDAGPNLGLTTYTYTVTDDLGKSKSVSFDVNVVSATTELSAPADFTWIRNAGGSGQYLDQFGLKWDLNQGGYAIVKTDEATKMVDLGSEAWTELTTKEGLTSAIDAGSDMDQYANVTTDQSATYNDVLGVRYNDTDYIIHVTNSTVVFVEGVGTNITIGGQFRY